MTAPTVTTTTEPAATTTRHTAFGDFTIRVAAGIVILVLWEVLVRAFAPPFVARPTGIIAAFPAVMANPVFWEAARATLTAVFQGLAIAFVAGTIIGVGIGRIRLMDRFSSLYISGLFAMPLTAILPLFSLWFGYTSDARLAVVVFAAFFSVVTNVSDGARAVPIEYIEVSRSFRGRALSRLFDVILPASVPYILAGLRLASGRALIGAVVAEFFVSIPGLGFFILFEARRFHHNEAFVGVALLALAGVLFEIALRKATAKWLPWYRRGTGD
jgi:ABC-type nitrate/sulfonate/bicarbonate transport system permease component